MSLEGKIFVLDDFVNNFRNDLTKRETIDRDLISSISVFRDLSKWKRATIYILQDTVIDFALQI